MPNYSTLDSQITVIKNKIDALTASALTSEEILYVAEALATLATALGVDDIVAATTSAIADVEQAGIDTIEVVQGTANGTAVGLLQSSYTELQSSYDNIEPRVASLEATSASQESNIANASALAAAATYNPWEIVLGDKLLVNRDRVLVIPNSTSPNVITLPTGPSVGTEVRIVDSAGTAGTTNFTVARNNELIMGQQQDLVINTNSARVHLVYSSANYGWRLV